MQTYTGTENVCECRVHAHRDLSTHIGIHIYRYIPKLMHVCACVSTHNLICLKFCLSVKTTEGKGKQLLVYIYLHAHTHAHIYIEHICAGRNIRNPAWFLSLLSAFPHSHLVLSQTLNPKCVRKSGLMHVCCSQSEAAGVKGLRGLSVQICLQS